MPRPDGFIPISVDLVGVQLSGYRTVLSQFHNLYFVASLDKIHVFEPQYSYQLLDDTPDLTLAPPPSRHGLPGHIDPSTPHAFNHLLMGELGTEEVLACACDDGDVLLYHTRAIANRIKSQKQLSLPKGGTVEYLTPFFHENVGRSAWGLAMHKASRVFAVSSNPGCIDVFVFDLSTPDPLANPGGSPAPDGIRKHGNRIRLCGHRANIPSISFSNSVYDPHCQWLASTDISGALYVWNIWTRELVIRRQAQLIGCRGWGVLCVDPQTFKSTAGPAETFGTKYLGQGPTVDISATRYEVPNPPPVFDHWSTAEAPFVDPQDPSLLLESGDLSPFTDGTDLDPDDDMDMFPDPTDEVESAIVMEPEYAQHSDGEEAIKEAETEAEAEEEDEEADGAVVPEPAPGPPKRIAYPPRFSLIHTSDTCVRFIATPAASPTVACHRVLTNNPMPHMELFRYDRLNLLQHVPELSLVVVGCQSGRVALFTLTWQRGMEGIKGRQPPFGMRLDYILPFTSQNQMCGRPSVPLLGIAVGPIQGREKAVDPDGLDATVPARNRAQGWEKVERRRRYRLMLTYQDHTVHSYEMGRMRGHMTLDPYGEPVAD
ncbi:MAG: hypothetical protein M1826_002722 [Phylliscum demangeonii]|nr:MAG: hypothetical protein M1826_002722 [Phylliscum demangeonii]